MLTMGRISRHTALLVCVVMTLITRAAIPAGYMPATAGSGLLFEICPSAVPAEILAAMSGSGHQHHHGEEAADSHFDAEQCPIGQLLNIAVAIDIANPIDEPPTSLMPTVDVLPPASANSPVNRRSRSPPA